jgi:hypothetical protein
MMGVCPNEMVLKLTKVKGALLLNVVVGKSATILELFPGENQALLVGRDALLVLNLRLDIVDEDSTSRVIVLPVNVLMKICIPPQRRNGEYRGK